MLDTGRGLTTGTGCHLSPDYFGPCCCGGGGGGGGDGGQLLICS